MLAEYQEIAKQCSSSNATYEQYLQEMAAAEIQKRDSNATSRRINAAKIPTMKELSDFDFASIPSLNKAKVVELSQCSYIASHTNVVIMGPPGVGKTHVAIALTLAACRHGCGARFFTAADIVNTYREARESKTILRLEASLRRMDLIVTTNLPFGQWPSTFAGEERMTGALLDRFTHRLEVLTINDTEESYRVKQARKNNKKKS